MGVAEGGGVFKRTGMRVPGEYMWRVSKNTNRRNIMGRKKKLVHKNSYPSLTSN